VSQVGQSLRLLERSVVRGQWSGKGLEKSFDSERVSLWIAEILSTIVQSQFLEGSDGVYIFGASDAFHVPFHGGIFGIPETPKTEGWGLDYCCTQ
jgi:hypothetical protein